MRSFTDKQGRTWQVQLGLATCRHIVDQTEGRVDFVEQARTGTGKEVFELLANDLQLLGQVAWLLCETQAQEIGCSELDFAESFDMDVLESLQTALIGAVIDFFPSRSRPLLQRALAIADKIASEENAQLQTKIDNLMTDPQFEETIRRSIKRATPGGGSGNGLGSSDSPPASCGGHGLN